MLKQALVCQTDFTYSYKKLKFSYCFPYLFDSIINSVQTN